jgi:Zn-dependent peptidase ImmA (M78 family)
VEYRNDGPPGMLVCRDGMWVVSVLAGDGLERQRFTIAHEGGHTFQPDFKRGGLFLRCKGQGTRTEQLCDIAAAELLLPRRWFNRDVSDAGHGLDAVEAVAAGHVASVEATAWSTSPRARPR